MKVSELEGVTLDAAVAKCEGYELDSDGDNRTIRENGGAPSAWHPSTDWQHGGPIIDRERITTGYCKAGPWAGQWYGQLDDELPKNFHQTGHTLLIAAMRTYVASKLGDEVEL